MTDKEIIEGNILIAEFMNKQDVLGTLDTEPFVTNVYFDASQIRQRMEQGIKVKLYYHSSWDWIMPVVEKINTMDNREYDVIIWRSDCHINDRDSIVVEASQSKATTLIQTVWWAIVQFIQWYNTQTPKS